MTDTYLGKPISEYHPLQIAEHTASIKERQANRNCRSKEQALWRAEEAREQSFLNWCEDIEDAELLSKMKEAVRKCPKLEKTARHYQAKHSLREKDYEAAREQVTIHHITTGEMLLPIPDARKYVIARNNNIKK